MVVGFVNSGLLSLKQAIHVIMGANVGHHGDRLDFEPDGVGQREFLCPAVEADFFYPGAGARRRGFSPWRGAATRKKMRG